jgi:hypothetical protein
MDDEDPSNNGGATIIFHLIFSYKMSPHMWPSIIHDFTKENHMRNNNNN